MNRRVAIIVLNWNRAADTIQCLESLRAVVRDGVALIIVVDNASTDESVAHLRSWLDRTCPGYSDVDDTGAHTLVASDCAEYIFLRSSKNGGYAAGNNLGIGMALCVSGIEFIFILNNDTIVAQGSIEALIVAAEHSPGVGAWGVSIRESPKDQPIAGGAAYNPLLTNSIPSRAVNGIAKGRLDYLCGAAMFVRSEVFRTVGLLNEEFFLFFEELDLAYRMKTAGFGIAWCPAAMIFHDRGRSTGSAAIGGLRNKSALAEYHSNRSCLLFTRLHHRRLFIAAALLRLALKIPYCLFNGRPRLLSVVFRSYWDALREG
jgi:GT2 family glycosyltransferase